MYVSPINPHMGPFFLDNMKPGYRLEYMEKLTRNQTSIIFQRQTRILKVKTNYKKDKKKVCRKGEESKIYTGGK